MPSVPSRTRSAPEAKRDNKCDAKGLVEGTGPFTVSGIVGLMFFLSQAQRTSKMRRSV